MQRETNADAPLNGPEVSSKLTTSLKLPAAPYIMRQRIISMTTSLKFPAAPYIMKQRILSIYSGWILPSIDWTKPHAQCQSTSARGWAPRLARLLGRVWEPVRATGTLPHGKVVHLKMI